MTEFADGVGPVVGTSASLDTDEARFDLTKELQHLGASQGTSNDDVPVFGDGVGLEDRLGQIQSDCDNLLHGAVPSLLWRLASPR